MLKQRFIP